MSGAINPQADPLLRLRYELHPGYYDRYGDIGNFDPTVALVGPRHLSAGQAGAAGAGLPGQRQRLQSRRREQHQLATVNGAPCMPVLGNAMADFPAGLKKVPHLRFMPRFGFAYRPAANDKWAIRGGFGIYQINMLGSSFYSLTGTVQAQTQHFTNSYDPATHAIGFQWPQIYPGSGGSGCTNSYGTDYFGTANSVNWKDPYTEQWSLSVDHDFGSGYAVRASYIGSATRQLVWAPDENTLPFSTTVSAFNGAHHRAPVPQLGPHQYPRHRRQLQLRLVPGGGESSPAAGARIPLHLHLGQGTADNQGPVGMGFGGEGGGHAPPRS